MKEKNHKTLEYNVGEYLYDLKEGNTKIQKAQNVKAKINKLGLQLYLKVTICQKQQSEKHFLELFPSCNFLRIKIQKIERTLTNQYEKGNQVKHYAKDSNRHFTEEETQMAHKHWERCSIFFITREL